MKSCRKVRWFVVSFLAALHVMAFESVAVANLVANGSFESYVANGPDDGVNGTEIFSVGVDSPIPPHNPTSIAGWTLSGSGDVYLHQTPAISQNPFQPQLGTSFSHARTGSSYLDLSGGIRGGGVGQHATVYQDLATTPNTAYSLTFYVGSAHAPLANSIGVRIDGSSPILDTTVTPVDPAGTPVNIVWQEITFTFVANSMTTRLSFQGKSNFDDNRSFVDDVSVVTAIPEASSLLLVGVVGLMGAAGAFKGRKMDENAEKRLK